MIDNIDGLGNDPGMVRLASELEMAFAVWTLSDQTRARLLSRALDMAPAAATGIHPVSVGFGRRRPSLPRLYLRRRAPAVLGGAALVALAAIGIGVVHHRRSHGTAPA